MKKNESTLSIHCFDGIYVYPSLLSLGNTQPRWSVAAPSLCGLCPALKQQHLCLFSSQERSSVRKQWDWTRPVPKVISGRFELWLLSLSSDFCFVKPAFIRSSEWSLQTLSIIRAAFLINITAGSSWWRSLKVCLAYVSQRSRWKKHLLRKSTKLDTILV